MATTNLNIRTDKEIKDQAVWMTLRRRWKYEVNILADGGSLDARYRDHELSGNYKGVST